MRDAESFRLLQAAYEAAQQLLSLVKGVIAWEFWSGVASFVGAGTGLLTLAGLAWVIHRMRVWETR
jgi:hypothetical protein